MKRFSEKNMSVITYVFLFCLQSRLEFFFLRRIQRNTGINICLLYVSSPSLFLKYF